MWSKGKNPYFDLTRLMDFHLGSMHSLSNMSANRPDKSQEKRKVESKEIVIKQSEIFKIDNKKLDNQLKEVFKNRRTSWAFNCNMTKEKLGILLKRAIGITEEDVFGNLKRAYPTAGLMFSINFYIYLSNFGDESIDRKIFKYNPDREELEEVNSLKKGEIDEICSMTKIGEYSFEASNCLFFFTTNFSDLFSRYGQLSYRLSLLEAGHACENIQIAASLMGINSVPLGGFYDEKVRELIKSNQEYCIYILALG